MRAWVRTTMNVTSVWRHDQTNGDSQCSETKHNAHKFTQVSIANHEGHRKQTITWHHFCAVILKANVAGCQASCCSCHSIGHWPSPHPGCHVLDWSDWSCSPWRQWCGPCQQAVPMPARICCIRLIRSCLCCSCLRCRVGTTEHLH